MTGPPLDAIGYQIAVARQIGALTHANACVADQQEDIAGENVTVQHLPMIIV